MNSFSLSINENTFVKAIVICFIVLIKYDCWCGTPICSDYYYLHTLSIHSFHRHIGNTHWPIYYKISVSADSVCIFVTRKCQAYTMRYSIGSMFFFSLWHLVLCLWCLTQMLKHSNTYPEQSTIKPLNQEFLLFQIHIINCIYCWLDNTLYSITAHKRWFRQEMFLI